MVSNIYLKFSGLTISDKDEKPFSDTYGATSAVVLTEFLSLDDIAYSSIEGLVAFVKKKCRNCFSDPYVTAKLLQKAARNSYRLDKVLYEPLSIFIASSFNVIKALENEVKTIDKVIKKTSKILILLNISLLTLLQVSDLYLLVGSLLRLVLLHLLTLIMPWLGMQTLLGELTGPVTNGVRLELFTYSLHL